MVGGTGRSACVCACVMGSRFFVDSKYSFSLTCCVVCWWSLVCCVQQVYLSSTGFVVKPLQATGTLFMAIVARRVAGTFVFCTCACSFIYTNLPFMRLKRRGCFCFLLNNERFFIPGITRSNSATNLFQSCRRVRRMVRRCLGTGLTG